MTQDPGTSAPRRRPSLGVSVCVWRNDDVLLVRRGKAPAKGLWAPVGGHVEWGETLEAAAQREVAEETGVICEITGFSAIREIIAPTIDSAPDFHTVLIVFAARWISGDARAGDDADAVQWVSAGALDQIDLIPGTIPFIVNARSR